jgi:hypothetical protein
VPSYSWHHRRRINLLFHSLYDQANFPTSDNLTSLQLLQLHIDIQDRGTASGITKLRMSKCKIFSCSMLIVEAVLDVTQVGLSIPRSSSRTAPVASRPMGHGPRQRQFTAAQPSPSYTSIQKWSLYASIRGGNRRWRIDCQCRWAKFSGCCDSVDSGQLLKRRITFSILLQVMN